VTSMLAFRTLSRLADVFFGEDVEAGGGGEEAVRRAPPSVDVAVDATGSAISWPDLRRLSLSWGMAWMRARYWSTVREMPWWRG
jgi:hypothetical protein